MCYNCKKQKKHNLTIKVKFVKNQLLIRQKKKIVDLTFDPPIETITIINPALN